MKIYRYILEPYNGIKTRYRCPECNDKNKTFTLYIDTLTGEYLHNTVGRCNRESKCGYHYSPKEYFEENKNEVSLKNTNKDLNDSTFTNTIKATSFIDIEIFKSSLINYETNNFIKYLINFFGIEITNKLINQYFIGSSKHWIGSTVFWQIDIKGKVRAGKIMLYNSFTGKRIKELFNHINWVHKTIGEKDFEVNQCFFGEHLLHEKSKPIAIVESEKTAIIASAYLPNFLWLAVGSLTNLNLRKCNILMGRIVILFPDLNGYEKWKRKANEFSHHINITVSDLLERKATVIERKQGLDLADYLIRFKLREFILK